MKKNQFFRFILISLSVLVYFQIIKPRLDTKPGEPQTSSNLSPKALHSLPTSPFGASLEGKARDIMVENQVFKVTLSTKGGMIKRVELKNHKDKHGQPVVLVDEQSSSMGFSFPYKDTSIETKGLYFHTTADPVYVLQGEEEAQIAFRLNLAPDQYLEQQFSFTGTSYKVYHTWHTVGMSDCVQDECPVSFRWDMDMKSLESDVKADASRSTINYYLANNVFDNLSESSSKLEQLKVVASIKWVAMKQRFFTSAIIAGDTFAGGNISIAPITTQEDKTKAASATLLISERSKEKGGGSFSFFFGPNDYSILSKIAPGFQQNLPLGWAMVRLINQMVIIPIFSFLEKYVSNYGLVILFLVIITKLILAPFAYKSYISLAKIKLIKPELDAIKERYQNDPQRIQNEQMLLYKELKINPLSGCMPILLQMPVLLAMFNFFPNAIALRQASFLWATDLSTYDSVLRLPFAIPIYGDHVSLFTMLMVISTILYTQSSNQNSSSEAPMKMLAYVMPISFMFVLNSFPAGLSFYYFVSNIFSYLQQALTRYFVDEEMIKEKLLIRRRRGDQVPAPSFQAKIASAIQAKNKNKKKKE
ncbi:MAG TPA: membrane protein insertase YidC [Amoebophilaceae bacterium]|jgi:YidC/Oxa1 family membrane protein insertase|nr:membrane protein insertase YidC [Amoebophilaceae bacterium]